MVTEGQILTKLKSMVSEKRYYHSIRVRDIAVGLAKKYNADVNKVNIAALLHDCAKGYSYEESVMLCEEYKASLDDIFRECRQLIHAPLGAKIAEIEYGVEDEEIINAIYYHTTGRENMTMIDKIVCISDYIEPNRKYAGIERIRELASKDIDKALFYAFGLTISFIISRELILHPLTVIARNSLYKNDYSK